MKLVFINKAFIYKIKSFIYIIATCNYRLRLMKNKFRIIVK